MKHELHVVHPNLVLDRESVQRNKERLPSPLPEHSPNSSRIQIALSLLTHPPTYFTERSCHRFALW